MTFLHHVVAWSLAAMFLLMGTLSVVALIALCAYLVRTAAERWLP